MIEPTIAAEEEIAQRLGQARPQLGFGKA